MTSLHCPLVALAIVVGLVGFVAVSSGVADDDSSAAWPAVVTVDTAAVGRAVPAGFLGLSLEYPSLETYAGRNARALDPLFARIIRSLSPGQSPVIRIGGDSTDHTWWPVPKLRRPPGVSHTLTDNWIAAAKALADTAGAKLIPGINLEAGSPSIARTEARTLINGIGARSIAALELGNEPELYRSFGWYRAPNGRRVPGRQPRYNFPAFTREFSRFANALPRIVRLAGPAVGGQEWITHVPQFVAHQPRLGLVTIHRYPFKRCGLPAASQLRPTIANLLSSTSSNALAAGMTRYVDAAHARGLKLRVDELNSVACGGQPGVSNSFASALWALDATFQLVRLGVDGVNVHTFPNGDYAPFELTHDANGWHALAQPEYYGLLMFARAAPRGSRLLPLSGGAAGRLAAWATRGPDGRVRVILINDATARARMVTVRVRGRPGAATLQRLEARRVQSTTGVTLAGQTLGANTATLTAHEVTETVRRVGRGYTVRLPAASAALLTLPRR